MKKLQYKFNEGELAKELVTYINNTYGGHYSKNNFQSTEFIIDCGHGMGFAIGNVLKYAQRYGKKDGHNRTDLMKILHYALIALHVHDLNEVKKTVVNSPKFIDESFFTKFGNKIYFLIILLYTMSFFLFKKPYE